MSETNRISSEDEETPRGETTTISSWNERNGDEYRSSESEKKFDDDNDNDDDFTPSPPPPPKEGKVSRIIQEVIDTERSYVADLTTIIEGYQTPSLDRDVFRDRDDDFMAIFSNINEICEFHEVFLVALEQAQGDPARIGKAFIENEGGFRQYTLYCTNYPRAVAILTDYGQNKSPIFNFLKERQRHLGHLLPLGSYLLKPVQRILKYRLLLLDLVKSTDRNLRGYDTLQQALLTMTSVAEHINEMKKRDEATVRVQEIQSLLTDWKGDDLSLSGFLLMEAVLKVPGARDPRWVFLFQKRILITKKREDGHFSYKSHYDMNDMVLTEFVANQPLSFQISQFSNLKNNVVLQCSSLENKQKWVVELRRLVLDSLPNLPVKAREMVLGISPGKDVGMLPYHHTLTPIPDEQPRSIEKGKAATFGRRKQPTSLVAPSRKEKTLSLSKKNMTIDTATSVASLRPPTPTRGKPRAQSLFDFGEETTQWVVENRDKPKDDPSDDETSLRHRRNRHVSKEDLEKLRKSRAMERYRSRKESSAERETPKDTKNETPPPLIRRSSRTVSRLDRRPIRRSKETPINDNRPATFSASPLQRKKSIHSPIIKRRNSMARQSIRRKKTMESFSSKSGEAYVNAKGKMAARGSRTSVYSLAGDLAGELVGKREKSPLIRSTWDDEETSDQDSGWDILIVDAIFRKYSISVKNEGEETVRTEELWKEEASFLEEIREIRDTGKKISQEEQKEGGKEVEAQPEKDTEKETVVNQEEVREKDEKDTEKETVVDEALLEKVDQNDEEKGGENGESPLEKDEEKETVFYQKEVVENDDALLSVPANENEEEETKSNRSAEWEEENDDVETVVAEKHEEDRIVSMWLDNFDYRSQRITPERSPEKTPPIAEEKEENDDEKETKEESIPVKEATENPLETETKIADDSEEKESLPTTHQLETDNRDPSPSPPPSPPPQTSAACDVGQLLASFDLPELEEQRADVSATPQSDSEAMRERTLSLDQALRLEKDESKEESNLRETPEVKSPPSEGATSTTPSGRGIVKLMARSYSKMVHKLRSSKETPAEQKEISSRELSPLREETASGVITPLVPGAPGSERLKRRIKSEASLEFEGEFAQLSAERRKSDYALGSIDWESDTGSVSSEASSQASCHLNEGEESGDSKKKKKKRRGTISRPAKGWVKRIAAKFGSGSQ